ncbi:MAG: recombinase family protein [Oscillospiraceae bacterium]
MNNTAENLAIVGRRAVAYIRVSTEKEEQKTSLANQREFFESYVVGRGDELVGIYCDEGKSATKMKNRKELQAMLKAARAHAFDRLYVKDVSRLFRNMRDFINVTQELAELGISVYFVDMGGRDADPFILGIFAMLAESESQKMSTRIKFAKNMSKEKGIVPNFVFGYDRVDKFTVVPNKEEADTVKLIFNKYTEEGWGQARIAKYLHEHGYKTKKMKEDAWSQNTVACILKNQLYIGKVVNGRQTTKGLFTNQRDEHPEEEWIVVERPAFRIISDEQFQKAHDIMEKNSRLFPSQSRRSEKHIFSNLIKCGECGFSYRRYQRQNVKDGPIYAWWTCSKRAAYGSNRCTAEHIRIEEEWLLSSIRLLLGSMVEDKPRFFSIVEQKCNAIIKTYLQETQDADMDTIKSEYAKLDQERTRIKEMARRGIIDMDEAQHDMAPLNMQMDRLRFKLAQVSKTAEVTGQIKKAISKFMSDFSALKLTENLDNAALRHIIRKIVVISKEEIHIYFNVGDDDNFSFPIRLSDFVPIDTNTAYCTQGFKRAPPHV